MNSTITLRRTIPLEGWHVAGTIAFAVKREWEPALMLLATKMGSVTPDAVAGELLGGRKQIARRLIRICEHLGLLERQKDTWVPTEAGKKAATTGMVLVPEQGTWTLWGAIDPLLADPLVAVTAWREPTAYEDNDKNRAARTMQNLPEWLIRMVSRTVQPLNGEHEGVRIDHLPSGEAGKTPLGEPADASHSLQATLTLAPASVRLHFGGTVERSVIDCSFAPPVTSYEVVWRELLRHSGLEPQWNSHRRAMLAEFEKVTSSERSEMKRTVRFVRPSLVGLGEFDDLVVDSVPLLPRSEQDAAAWGEWRLINNLNTFVSDSEYQSAYRSAVAAFEDLAPPCPERRELAKRLRGIGRPPPAYWYLQAPIDWSFAGGESR